MKKVKINSGAPFLKAGANMKFYEAIFTIIIRFFYNDFALRFGPIVNISFSASHNRTAHFI